MTEHLVFLALPMTVTTEQHYFSKSKTIKKSFWRTQLAEVIYQTSSYLTSKNNAH